VLTLYTTAALSADYPAPKEGDWVAKDFKFHTGEVLPTVNLHYTTVGAATGEPVLVLHGTLGAGSSFLNADFADQLFGPGQPLDATKYYIILPDALGSGKSTKPSDGLRAKFPLYNYDDMVAAQYRLVTEGLGVKRLRLVIGNSMGGMQTWLWGVTYPQFMDALVPMASQPTEMAGRNWMTRRMLTEAVRRDPEWNKGDYTKQPTAFRFVNAFFGITTSGGTQGYYQQADTRAKADKLVDTRLGALTTADANDFLYLWDSSRDYNAAPRLDRVEAWLLAINSADDERNPPELGIMERELKRVKHGKLYLIPASPDTRGHGTTGMATLWKTQLQKLLQTAPRRF
jgi:homoserine O-acetyltransferase